MPETESFEVRLEVADNQAGAPATLAGSGSLGSLNAQCNDQSTQAGVEDPVVDLNCVGGADQAPLRVFSGNTFTYHVQLGEANAFVAGMARQEGRGTAAGTCFVSGTLTRID